MKFKNFFGVCRSIMSPKTQQDDVSFFNNCLFVLSFLAIVFLPDICFRIFLNLPIHTEITFLAGTIGFGFLLSFTNGYVYGCFAVVIFIMQTVQLNYMAFFGESIAPENILNIVREARDVFDPAYLKQTWFVVPLLAGLFGINICLFRHKKMIKIKWIWILLFYLAAHKPYRAYTGTKGIWYFQPSISRPSLKNSISTFSYFFFQYWPKGYKNVSLAYTPYEIKSRPSETQNILLIWGESLYARHLPMFGYARDTFPRLGKRLKTEKNWLYATSISGGIATATSTLLFFNTIREPANAAEIKKHTANLFKIAKQNGFSTYYYSNQESRLTMGLGSKYIDYSETNDSKKIFFAKHKDEGLNILLQEIDFSHGKNFIVLHMRSPHLPYENRYKGREAEFEKFLPTKTSNRYEYMVNTYDNALLYTDFVVDKIIDTFNEKSKGTANSVYFAADHGQLFDYNGHWGHNDLVIEQGITPFFVRKTNAGKLPKTMPHYEIGKLILGDLGAELVNPNEEASVYYLHSNNIDYPYDYIKYKINSDGTAKELFVGNTGTDASKKRN